jgi:hypothetical protein
VLAERFEAKRLNSPNDLIWSRSGTLYFSDPPFGLPRVYDGPRKELAFSGVSAWKDGVLRLVTRDLIGPNGLALSPDAKHLGSVRGPLLPANLEWGDDGHALYLTARSALYRLPLLSRGGRR